MSTTRKRETENLITALRRSNCQLEIKKVQQWTQWERGIARRSRQRTEGMAWISRIGFGGAECNNEIESLFDAIFHDEKNGDSCQSAPQ
jgi:hypothetical protein